MDKNFLEKNPFYLLEVNPIDNRKLIIDKAEKKVLLLDNNIYDEALSVLLTPSKKINAEIDWFCNCNENDNYTINKSIEEHHLINLNTLTGIDKLNATIYNFIISSYKSNTDIINCILDLDKQFCNIDIPSSTEIINQCHSISGISSINEETIINILNKKREQICRCISNKIKDLDEDIYIDLITHISDKFYINDKLTEGLIIKDIVAQYELNMQSNIDRISDEITLNIENTENMSNKKDIIANVHNIIFLLKKWYNIIKPIELNYNISSNIRNEIEHIVYKIRNFSLWLHNDKDLTQVALLVTNTAKDLFSNFDIYLNLFSKDSITLSKISYTDKEINNILSEIDKIDSIINNWKSIDINDFAYEINEGDIAAFISSVISIDNKIKSSNLDDDLINKFRIGLCIIVRNGAIFLHNENNETHFASSISDMLKSEFGDISELHSKLSNDCYELHKQLLKQSVNNLKNISHSVSTPTYTNYTNYTNTKSYNLALSLIIKLVIFLVILIIFYFAGNSSTQSNTTQTPEVYFSDSLIPGTNVYASISTILPQIGIYYKNSSEYRYYICECTTVSGSKLWVYISTDDYKKLFDPYVSTKTNSLYANKITFNNIKKIHGVIRKSNSIMDDLASEISSTTLIEFYYIDK